MKRAAIALARIAELENLLDQFTESGKKAADRIAELEAALEEEKRADVALNEMIAKYQADAEMAQAEVSRLRTALATTAKP